ncbi:hypothetical protein ACQPWY_34895 [Pseudonocardia xinjiangensis]|uniref:hypothetical protein n=1 Tax=Pseudonocardia xinjiangensis TaxID=75289 RepID=UPI003D8DA608
MLAGGIRRHLEAAGLTGPDGRARGAHGNTALSVAGLVGGLFGLALVLGRPSTAAAASVPTGPSTVPAGAGDHAWLHGLVGSPLVTVAALVGATVVAGVVVRAVRERIRRAVADPQHGLAAMLHDVEEARLRLADGGPGHAALALRLMSDAERGLGLLGRRLSGPAGRVLLPGWRRARISAIGAAHQEIAAARRAAALPALVQRTAVPDAEFWEQAWTVVGEREVAAGGPVGEARWRRHLLELLAPAWVRPTVPAGDWSFLDRHGPAAAGAGDRLAVALATALIEPGLPEPAAQLRLLDRVAHELAAAVVELDSARGGREYDRAAVGRLVVVELGVTALRVLHEQGVLPGARAVERVAAARQVLDGPLVQQELADQRAVLRPRYDRPVRHEVAWWTRDVLAVLVPVPTGRPGRAEGEAVEEPDRSGVPGTDAGTAGPAGGPWWPGRRAALDGLRMALRRAEEVLAEAAAAESEALAAAPQAAVALRQRAHDAARAQQSELVRVAALGALTRDNAADPAVSDHAPPSAGDRSRLDRLVDAAVDVLRRSIRAVTARGPRSGGGDGLHVQASVAVVALLLVPETAAMLWHPVLGGAVLAALAGGAVIVAGVAAGVAVTRWVAVRRQWAARHRERTWEAEAAAAVPAADQVLRPELVWGLVTAQYLDSVAATGSRRGVGLARIHGAAGRLGGETGWSAELARRLAAAPSETTRALDDLVRVGLLVVERAAGRQAEYRPGEVLVLLERAPPAYVAALLRNPAAMVVPGRPHDVPLADLAAAIRAGLREAVWDATAVASGRRGWLPLRLRGGAHELRELFGPVRVASADVERARWELSALRRAHPVAERLQAELAEGEQRLWQAQERERAATLAAVDAAAAAGFRRRDAGRERDRALLGWKRYMAAVAGVAGAFPGHAAGAYMLASQDFADHYGQSATWVTQQGAVGTSVTAGAGLAVATLGDRLIKNMALIVGLGVVGAIGLAAIGSADAAVLFLPSMIMVGVMGLGGGLVRGRMEIYHPVSAELKDSRDSQYETASKVFQLPLPILIAQGFAVAGLPATMVVLAVVTIGLTALVWVMFRGETSTVTPRAPPPGPAAVVGMMRQVVGTPGGLLRWVASIPLLTLVTGMYASALGAAMLDQFVLLNDPVQAVLSTSTAVTVLVLVRGVTTVVMSAAWPRAKKLLGSRGAIARLFGRPVAVQQVSEARVLRAITGLPLVLLVPAAWLVVAPGLWPAGMLFIAGGALVTWSWMSMNRWMEGATGASAINTAKMLSFAVGAAVSSAVLGRHIEAVRDRVDAGTEYAAAVHAGNSRLAALTALVVGAVLLFGRLVGVLRMATLDELSRALTGAGATEEQARSLVRRLAASGLRDVGSVRALYRSEGWTPLMLRGFRHAARARRQAAVGLAEDEMALLRAALDTFPGGSGGRSNSS